MCVYTIFILVTFPLDLTKTRLQIQGEGGSRQHGGNVQPPKYRGMLSTALGIVREEGPLKLWQGVTPAIYRHIGRMLISMSFINKLSYMHVWNNTCLNY